MSEYISDLKVITGVLNGNGDYSVLLARYKTRIYSFLLRMLGNPHDAEDVAQETFIKAYKNLASYDTNRPFISWLFAIAHNCAIDFIRKRGTQLLSLDDDENPVSIADTALCTEKAAQSACDMQAVESALLKLPPIYKEAFLLLAKEGLEYAEIAEITGVPISSVKIRIFRARQLIMKYLGEM